MLLAFFIIWSHMAFDLDPIGKGDWKLVREKKDISVFARKLEESEFKEIKVVGQVRSDMSEIVAALEDVEAQEEWVIRTIDAYAISDDGAGHIDYYISTDMPFPISDRDLIVSYEREQDPSTKVVKTHSTVADHDIVLQDGFVRVPHFESTYTLTPIGDDLVQVEYYMMIDPGGDLPVWLVNMAAAKGPYDTIRSLFDLIQSGTYEDAVVSGVVD